MNSSEFKQKIKDDLISDEELDHLLNRKQQNHSTKRGGLVNNLIKGYIDGVSTPQLWKVVLESTLIFAIIVGVVFLSYVDKLDTAVSSVILAGVLGFIFGKMK